MSSNKEYNREIIHVELTGGVRMENNIEELVGKAINASSLFKIMVVDSEMNIVWHNVAHGEMFAGDKLVGKKCYETLGSDEIHKGCPTCISISTCKEVKGLYDFGTQNSMILSLPLSDEYFAKIMIDVPKEADGKTIVSQ